jgi:hypothetical protein
MHAIVHNTSTVVKPQPSLPRTKPVGHGAMFGPWRYDARHRTIDFMREDGPFPSSIYRPGWWIRVDRALHLSRTEGYLPQKTWLTASDVADFERALQALSEVQ